MLTEHRTGVHRDKLLNKTTRGGKKNNGSFFRQQENIYLTTLCDLIRKWFINFILR